MSDFGVMMWCLCDDASEQWSVLSIAVTAKLVMLAESEDAGCFTC